MKRASNEACLKDALTAEPKTMLAGGPFAPGLFYFLSSIF